MTALVAVVFLVSLSASTVGLGGAILLIPALLYVLPLLGGLALEPGPVSGLTSVVVLAASGLAILVHGRRRQVDGSVVLSVGMPMVLGSLLGALLSGGVSGQGIVAVFAALALTGALLMLRSRQEPAPSGDPFSRPLAATLGGIMGLASGVAGAPGAFLLAPVLMVVLRVPTRRAVGSTLAIVFFTALATSAGKLAAGLVPWPATGFAVAAAVPGGWLGALLSHRVPVPALRRALSMILVGVALRMGWELLA